MPCAGQSYVIFPILFINSTSISIQIKDSSHWNYEFNSYKCCDKTVVACPTLKSSYWLEEQEEDDFWDSLADVHDTLFTPNYLVRHKETNGDVRCNVAISKSVFNRKMTLNMKIDGNKKTFILPNSCKQVSEYALTVAYDLLSLKLNEGIDTFINTILQCFDLHDIWLPESLRYMSCDELCKCMKLSKIHLP